MAYVKGDTITASDLNTFLTTVNSVYGVGNGNAGYGQTSLLAAVASGATITSADWTSLRTMIAACATHQGTAVTSLMPSSVLAVGQSITAHEISPPSSNTFDLDSHVTAINTNRLVATPGSMSVIAGTTVTRASAWPNTITCTVDVVWSTEDQARFFFNSGGQLRLNFVHPNGSGNQDTDWRNILVTKLGEVRLGAAATTNSGTVSMAASSIGFYNLTTSAQAIITGTNVGTGAYAVNDISVTAQVLNKVGVNGGNGTTVRFVILLSDQYAGPESVSTGTAVSISAYKATTYLTSIATPTYTVQTPF